MIPSATKGFAHGAPVAWLALGLLCATGCRTIEDFTVDSFAMKEVRQEAGDWVLDIRLNLDNPNRFPVALDPASLTLKLEGDSIGHLDFGEGLRLQGHGVTGLDLEARLNARRTQDAALSNPMALFQGGYRLGVLGEVSGSSWGVHRTVAIRHEQALDLNLLR